MTDLKKTCLKCAAEVVRLQEDEKLLSEQLTIATLLLKDVLDTLEIGLVTCVCSKCTGAAGGTAALCPKEALQERINTYLEE